jgi:hypothetical protein
MQEIKLKFPSFYQLWEFKKEGQINYCEIDPLDNHITSVCNQEQIDLAVNKYHGKVLVSKQPFPREMSDSE